MRFNNGGQPPAVMAGGSFIDRQRIEIMLQF